MSKWPYFYGLQPRWFTPDRLFKVFTLSDSICAARVAGQFWDEQSARVQLAPAGILGVLAGPLVRQLIRRRTERETLYDSLAPGSTEFLGADRRNFVIHRAEVYSVVVSMQRCLWTGRVPNKGRIDIHLVDGSRKRLILLGEQDATTIVAQLSGSLGEVEKTNR
jgi:hypothetical protein